MQKERSQQIISEHLSGWKRSDHGTLHSCAATHPCHAEARPPESPVHHIISCQRLRPAEKGAKPYGVLPVSHDIFHVERAGMRDQAFPPQGLTSAPPQHVNFQMQRNCGQPVPHQHCTCNSQTAPDCHDAEQQETYQLHEKAPLCKDFSV